MNKKVVLMMMCLGSSVVVEAANNKNPYGHFPQSKNSPSQKGGVEKRNNRSSQPYSTSWINPSNGRTSANSPLISPSKSNNSHNSWTNVSSLLATPGQSPVPSKTGLSSLYAPVLKSMEISIEMIGQGTAKQLIDAAIVRGIVSTPDDLNKYTLTTLSLEMNPELYVVENCLSKGLFGIGLGQPLMFDCIAIMTSCTLLNLLTDDNKKNYQTILANKAAGKYANNTPVDQSSKS